MAVHRAAQRFGGVASEYERARPSYPDAAIAFLTERLGLRPGAVVADVGAGTGKLARLLVATGATVHAVEPVVGMREELAAHAPGVIAHDGTAEAMPFDDGALDAVTAAQAVHWFGPGGAAELARTLRSGGRIAIVYNRRDATEVLHRTISALRESVADGAPSYASLAWRAAFEQTPSLLEEGVQSFPWSWHLSHESVLEQVRSLAPVAALDEAARSDVLDQVGAVLAIESDPVEMSYATEVTLWRKR